jgi:signal transduction histidine kinase
VQRGWRGFVAEQTTAEGQGIGLFIVDGLCAANGGRFDIQVRGEVSQFTLFLPKQH